MTRVYKKRPDNCLGCHEPIRPRERPDQPGKPHAGNGYCDGCRSAWKRGVLGNKPEETIPPEQLENTRAGLTRFIQSRRARGVPIEGHQAA